MDPYVGEIRLFAFQVIPRGWLACQGQILAINTNQALFALLGTYYGGNGTTTFGLPDLRGRVIAGAVAGGPLGAVGGSETVPLTTATVPPHNHTLNVDSNAGTQTFGIGNVLASSPAAAHLVYGVPPASPVALNADLVSTVGGGLPRANMQPYLALQYCIATQGIFPSRG